MRDRRGPGLAQDPARCHWPSPPVALTCAHNALPNIVWKRDSGKTEPVSKMGQQPDRSVSVHRACADDEENRQKEMFNYNAELNKATTMPKAKSVFLILCKTFGSSKIGYTACTFAVVVSQSQVGWGFPLFTQTLLNDRKWTIMCCNTINMTMVLALPWLSLEGL